MARSPSNNPPFALLRRRKKLQVDTPETEEAFAEDDDTSDDSEEDEELCKQIAIASSTMMAYSRSAKALIQLVCNQDDDKVTFWEKCNQRVTIGNATSVQARMAKLENRECCKRCRPGWPPIWQHSLTGKTDE